MSKVNSIDARLARLQKQREVEGAYGAPTISDAQAQELERYVDPLNARLRLSDGEEQEMARQKRKKIIHWRPVEADTVKEWREKNKLTERQACEQLGISRGFLNSCEADGAPLYIGLAIAALESGLKPYRTKIELKDWRKVE